MEAVAEKKRGLKWPQARSMMAGQYSRIAFALMAGGFESPKP